MEGECVTLRRDLKNWLDIVVQWQQQALSLQLLIEQAEQCSKLTDFLQALRSLLVDIGSIDNVLRELPQVGPLLGRLTTLIVTMCHPKTYEALMACISFFYVNDPCTVAEKKAQDWVVSLVRNSVCVAEGADVNMLMEATGITQRQLNADTLKKLISEILDVDHVHNDCLDKSKYRATSYRDACILCLHLSEVPRLNLLLGRLVCSVHEYSPSNADEIYRIVTNSQKEAYGEKDCVVLTYETQRAVWTNYLPSLEQEVLLLVEACYRLPSYSTYEMKQMLQSRHLVQACAECHPMYETVFRILRSLYLEAYGSQCIRRLNGTLHAIVRQYCINNQSDVTLSLRHLSPVFIQPVVSLMEISPASLSQPAAESTLQELSKQLTELSRSNLGVGGGGDATAASQGLLRQVYIQHQEWSHMALLMALLGSRQTSHACCEIMLHFNCKNVSQHDKECLMEVVVALRALMMKSCVQWEDVQCTMSSTPHNIPQILLGELLIVFATHSVGGMFLVGRILEQIHQCNTASSKLIQMIDILEAVAEFWQGKIHLSPLRKTNITKLLETMENEAIRPETPGTEASNSQQCSKTFMIKCVDRLKIQIHEISS